MIDFLKFRPFSAALSVLIFATFIGTYLYKYNTNPNHQTFNYSVDFVGGIQLLLKFDRPVTGEQLVHILDTKGWPGTVTRQFSSTEHLIRVKNEASKSQDVTIEAEKIRTALEVGLGSNKVIVKQTDSVGSGMGSALRAKSLYALLLSLVLMLLYIALRFWSFSYAMGAIVSLFHDALVVLTIFLLFDKEISINVVGAILVVLGYSINDTIVIFSRIRENVQRMPGTPIAQVVNLSINETLSRTLLTTFATTLVVVALLVFGGETLRDLSLALLIGIVFGIYSTIFIACPVMLMLYKDNKAV
ncbi:protein translocase subunit SecF [Candidatus Dependentiae bacterium]|nr:protein translocase subunit SecF [Candidatus Dependentiae bacterium]